MNVPNQPTETEERTSDTTDAELIARFICQRDQAAYETLLLRHGPMVFGICCRILRSHHEAEDAFQATFLSLALNAAKIARPEQLANWLHSVARRASLRLKTLAAKRQKVGQQMEEQINPIDDSNSEQSREWSDVAPVLDAEISQLAADLRITVILCDVEGKTRKEAARELGWPEATVSTRLMKARSLLAQRLRSHGIVLSVATLSLLVSQNAASASVPASLVASTLQTASVISMGHGVPVGMASSKVVALAQEMVKPMIFLNLKIAATVIALITTAVLGLQLQIEESQAPVQVFQPAPTNVVELPPEVKLALEMQGEQLNPVSVNWTKQLKSVGRTNAQTFSVLKLEHRDPDQFFSPMKCVFKWQKILLYGSWEQTTKEWGRTFNEYAFDGAINYSGGHQLENKQLWKTLNSNQRRKEPHASLIDTRYFENCGVHIPSQFGELGKTNAVSKILSFLANEGKLTGARHETIDGKPTFVIELLVDNPETVAVKRIDLEQEKRDLEFSKDSAEVKARNLKLLEDQQARSDKLRIVYYLDPAYNYAVRQWENWNESQTLIRKCICSDFVRVGERDVWLPKNVTISFYEFFSRPGFITETPLLSETYSVTALSTETIPESQFVLNYTEPGTHIVDETSREVDGEPKQQESYFIGPTPGSKTNEPPPAGANGPANQAGPLAALPSTVLNWFLLANGFVILVIAAVFAYRRFIKS